MAIPNRVHWRDWLAHALRFVGIRPKHIAFRPGQVWRYATRPGEGQSRIQILQVDRHPVMGAIIHIAIANVRLLPTEGNGSMTTISHVPVSRDALERSGISLESEFSEIPEFAEGYEIWRTAFEDGTAGVFSIPAAEIVAVMETTIRDDSSGAA